MRSFCLFSLVLVFFSGCRDVVEDKFAGFELKPVVNSILIAGEKPRVHISFTANVSDGNIRFVEDAAVVLQDNLGNTDYLNYVGNGFYVGSLEIVESSIYTCHISVPGYDDIVAVDTIPEQQKVLSLEHINASGVNNEGEIYPAIQVTFSNNIHKRLYFEVAIKLLKYGEISSAALEEIVDPIIINEGLPIPVFSNKLMDSETASITLNYTTNTSNAQAMLLFPVVVELRTISGSYYEYLRSRYIYELGRYPDGLNATGNAHSLYTNVRKGYGIFGSYSTFTCDTLYPNGKN